MPQTKQSHDPTEAQLALAAALWRRAGLDAEQAEAASAAAALSGSDRGLQQIAERWQADPVTSAAANAALIELQRADLNQRQAEVRRRSRDLWDVVTEGRVWPRQLADDVLSRPVWQVQAIAYGGVVLAIGLLAVILP